MSLSFDYPSGKRRQKRELTKRHKQPQAYITNNQQEEPLQQNKARIVLGKKTYAETTKQTK